MLDIHLILKRCCFVLPLIAAVLGLLVAGTQSARAQALTPLYNFTGGNDGGWPMDGLVRDSGGNLYGTTMEGGVYNAGTVFEIPKKGPEKVLYSFTGSDDGAHPKAGLIRDKAGNLYGTTQKGGAHGCGTVFKLTPAGVETVLYSFAGGTDGDQPTASLVLDPKTSNLFGTTYLGGTYENGAVFQLTPDGTETLLYSFLGTTDGENPQAGLVRDAKGNLYGTTDYGSQGSTVFMVTPAGAMTVLHHFSGNPDGNGIEAGLIRDAKGNLYGTTYRGGLYESGTVFMITKKGLETVLYSFTGGSDGAAPKSRLVRDKAGNLYGTTTAGGAYGNGTVFELSPSGVETVLYSFGGGVDGATPYGNLVRDAKGNLYGTTWQGGSSNYGTVFKLTP